MRMFKQEKVQWVFFNVNEILFTEGFKDISVWYFCVLTDLSPQKKGCRNSAKAVHLKFKRKFTQDLFSVCNARQTSATY